MKESERMSATKRSFIMEPSSNNNTGTEDEETMAFHRKRARRVSFADKEITSIHIFRPDDTSSSGTPPGSASSAQTAPTPELIGLFRDLAGDSDEDDLKSSSSPPSCDDAGVAGGRCSFLRPVGSPSPGGSSAAISTDDEDGFHGPVSAGFIRPERLSDSGVSDDLTMDSTAFSLHYRSLARSDSGDLKTPTRFRLFNEKTPSHTSSPPPATTGSFMVLTKVKKQFSQPVVHAEAASGCRDTSDMSIVLDNPPTYDYDKLPTELNRILAEGSNDLHAISPTLDSEAAISSPCIDGLVMVQGSIDLSMRSTEAPCNYGCSTSSQMDQLTRGLLYNKGDHTVADGSVHRNKTPDTSAKEIKEFVKDAYVFVNKQLEFLNADEGRAPLKMGEENHLNVSVQSKHGHIVGQVRGSNSNDKGQVLNINEKDSEYKQTESFASLEERLCIITRENNMCRDLINTNDHGIESIRNIMALSQNEETVDTKNGEENFHLVSADSCNIKNSKPVEVTASPLQMTPLTRVRDCNLVDIMVENPKDDILSVMNQKLSLVDQRNCFGLLRQLDKQNASVDSGLGQDVEFNSEPAANIFGLSSYENSGKPSSDIGVAQLVKFAKEINESVKNSTVLVNKQSDLNGITPLNMGERNQLNMSAQSEHGYSVGQVQTSNPEDRGQLPDISGRDSEYWQVETPNDSLEEQLLSITRENDMHQGLVSTDNHRIESSGNITMLSQNAETVGTEKGGENFNLISVDISCNAKNPKPLEITASPLQMTPLTRVRDCNIVDGMVENINNHILGVVNARPFSSSANLLDQQLSQHVESQRSCFGELKQLVKQNESVNSGLGLDAECNSEAAAQSVEKLLSIDGHKKDEFGRINRSPEVHKIGNSDLQLVAEPTSSIRGERAKLGYQTWKNLADIMEELFGGEQHLLSPSIDKLNLRSICMLEDILGQLQKVKQCEILCSDIHPQKIIDPLHFSRHKRAVEARMLLLCLSYKKAKLQLRRVKHERLLEQVQHLSSGLQDSMKMKFISCSSTSEAVGTQSNDSHDIHISLLNSDGTCQVTRMREELESFASKAKSLSGFFHSFCKIETDQSCADIVESIRDYLQKKMSNKLIFQSLKLWAIEDFEVKDGGYIIVLNYGGYIIQRFKVSPRQPTVIISNKLNDVNIVKSFAGINAFSAFEFALNTLTTKKCFGSACLGQETQITSSHLSNLLDVVEEVQLSRIEIRNLVQAMFFSRSVEQLDLQLFFIDFCSGTNVKVTLDFTTCIKCGAYPVKVLPSQICGHANGVEHSLPSSLEYRIRTAAKSVRVGYSRIVRLCRRISQAVEYAT